MLNINMDALDDLLRKTFVTNWTIHFMLFYVLFEVSEV